MGADTIFSKIYHNGAEADAYINDITMDTQNDRTAAFKSSDGTTLFVPDLQAEIRRFSIEVVKGTQLYYKLKKDYDARTIISSIVAIKTQARTNGTYEVNSEFRDCQISQYNSDVVGTLSSNLKTQTSSFVIIAGKFIENVVKL